MNLIEQINFHKYLYLDKLVEINDLELEVYFNEARVESKKENDSKSTNSTKFGSIISDVECRRYRVIFKNYITYSVINESFSFWDKEDIYDGKFFRKYTKSKFISYVKSVASPGYLEIMNAEKFHHIGICCLNQIIDVACLEGPIIEELI
jgi:hypothetical protein